MTATLVEQLRQGEQVTNENALPAYFAMVPEAATSADVDQERAREILEAAGKTVDDLAADVELYNKRAVNIRQVVDADELGPALDAARAALADLNSELERVTQPIAERIAKSQSHLDRLRATVDRGRLARMALIEFAPEWLRAAIDETKRDANVLQNEVDQRLQPVLGEAIFEHGKWCPPSDFHGHVDAADRKRFDDFMRRRDADDERRAALQTRIALLKERRRRLENLAASEPWPTAEQIAAVDAELAADGANAEATNAAEQSSD